MAERSRTDLSTREGTSDLISYLVVRFVLVMFTVMIVESFAVWVESLLLPVLQGALEGGGVASQGTTSLFDLLIGVVGLLFSVVGGKYMNTIGPAWTSATALLLVAMLLLLLLPPLAGALVYARVVVRKIRSLQAVREQELAQIDQQRSQFITDIAHDLRTPLMAISGMAHAISDGVVRDDATRDEYVQSIGDKADKMSGLVSSVFDYTKLGASAFSLDRETVELPELLLREAAVVYSDIEDVGMTLSVEVPEEPCAVFADPVQLGRVVSNLLVNAARHNEAGIEIALLLVRQAGIAYVVVADTGTRIEGDAAELFQPFSRGDAARSNDGGSGLGLSICKRIADLHGYELGLVQPYGRFTKAFVLRCITL